MTLTPIILALFLLLFAPTATRGQHLPQKELSQFTHELWTTDDGLPQNSVNAVAQTSDGYLWIGTQEGLVRFDGVQFTTFDKSTTPQLKNNYITSLLVDSNDKLWIGTYDGGLLFYSHNRFTTVGTLKKFENSYVRTMVEDRNNGIWLSIRGRGVMYFDSAGTHATFDTSNGLSHNEVWAFCEDQRGRMWIGTENGISVYDHGRFSYFTTHDGLPSKYINALTTGTDSTMWIGSNFGLQNVSIDLHAKKIIKQITPKDNLPDRSVYCLAKDDKGALWIGTRNGLARLFNGRLSTPRKKSGIGFQSVTSLYHDRENDMWAGTDGSGLNVYRDGLFTTYTTQEGMPSDVVWSVFEDSRHNKWIGTDGGLVEMIGGNPKHLRYFTQKNGLYDNEIYSIAEDGSGRIWVGTVSGVNIIDHGKMIQSAPVLKTKGIVVSCIIKDSRNRMWVATSGDGVFKFDRTHVTILTTKDGLASNYTNSLFEDAHGNMCVGTDGEGISVLNDTGIVAQYTSHEASGNFIHSICSDSSGALWVGTFGGGISRIKDGTVSQITTKQGLLDDVIFNILEDNYGRMWLTSNKGIFSVVKKDLDRCADDSKPFSSCVSYGKESGLKSNECNGGVQPAGMKAADGTLWFPTSGGVSVVDPADITVNTTAPLVVIGPVRVDNQIVPLDTTVILEPDNQRLEIHYAGLSFLNPRKIQFKVKLEGYDRTWEDVGTRRTAYYTHLPAQTFVFHVIAANSDGVWNMQGATITIVRRGYFYETYIFYMGVLLFLFVAVYGIYRIRIRTIRQREFELERLVEERTADLRREQTKIEELLHETEKQRENAVNADTLKSQLVDMVAHHLKSPLVSITGLTNELENATPLNNLGMKYLKMIRFGTERMITLIKDLLNLSIIESGQINFSMEKHSLAELAGMIIDGYKFQAAKKEQTLTFVTDDDEDLTINADATRLQEAIENLVSNAVKYSPVGSVIRAGVYRYDTIVRFWITDAGPGISEEDQQLLFKRFKVLGIKPTGDETATGLGLAIVKEIVERHNGKVYIKSKVGNGSTFIVELPSA